MADAAAATDASKAGAEVTPKKGQLKIIIIAVSAVVLIGGGIGGFFLWRSGSAAHATAAKKAEPRMPAVFVPLDPPFVVNFQTADAVRFLQIEVRLSAKDAETGELLKQNDPILRNDLLLLFGNQDLQQLIAKGGRDRLRAQSLLTVRNVVRGVGGDAAKVDNVYFTSFVMQ